VKHTVTITELPVGTWTKDYKAFLEERLEVEEKRNKEAKKEAKKAETGSQSSSKGEIEPCGFKGCDDLYNDVDVCFVLYFTEEGYEAIKDHPEVFEKQFKLTTSWKTTNMTCFDASRTIVKYRTIGDLLEAFLEQRLPLYEARRHAILGILKGQNIELDAKRRFLQAVLDERLILQKKTDDDIVKQLMECAIPPLSCMDQPYAYDSYDYVLRMRMDRVKQSAIEELDGQIREKETEIARLEGETAASLWLADLAELEQAWNRMAAARAAESVAVASSESAVKAPRKRRPTVAKPHGNPTP
jgi:DNA topoisomerase-2